MIKRFTLAVMCFFLLGAPAFAKQAPASVNAPAVTIATPVVKQVADYLDLTGRTQAAQVVDLVARVPGYLQKIAFKEGSYVKKGQLLFTIEQNSYQQQVKLNSAKLMQAQSEYTRQQKLIEQNATSTSSLEKYLSERDQASASTELAKINLGYTEVRAPFDGRIGRAQVDVGNYVGAIGATKLATIEQIAPIYVYFNISERDVLRIQQAVEKAGGKAGGAVGKAPVWIGLQNEADYLHKGILDYLGLGISQDTGTMEARAVLMNEDNALLSGLFARVRIPLGSPQAGVLVPDSAIQRDQTGFFVMVVDAENIVHRQYITTGPVVDGLRVVLTGLNEAQHIIINGLSNVSDGHKVAPEKGAITRGTVTSATPMMVNPEKK